MKKKFLCLLILIIANYNYSQNYDYVNEDYGESKDSQLLSNEKIILPLYEIEYQNGTLPIYITYDNKGLRVGDIPSSLGYNWNIHAGGKIEKEVRHKIDESKEGWFFDNYVENLQTGILSVSNNIGNPIYRNTDVSPDIFRMNISNGDNLEYFYNRTLDQNGKIDSLYQVSLSSNQDYMVYTDLGRLKYFLDNEYADDSNYEYDSQGDIIIRNRKGEKYIFRKGEKVIKPWSLKRKIQTYRDSTYIRDFYLHKVENAHNNEALDFEYVTAKINKLIYYQKSGRIQTNSEPQTPPGPNDQVISQGFYNDISVEDRTRKEISRITTSRETIEFIYKTHDYISSFDESEYQSQNINISGVKNQKIKLLDAINIFDYNGNYILGYEFNYTEQTQNQEDFEGILRLKSIFKVGKNRKNKILFKGFNYFNEPFSENIDSHAIDVLGYANGISSNNNLVNSSPIKIFDSENLPNRLPNKDVITQGMLESIINSSGGKIEYSYKENSFEEMYFGGVLVDTIKNYDSDNKLLLIKAFEYEDPEGFGLPIYSDWVIQQGGFPPNIYKEGYFEQNHQGANAWQTYFTKRNPFMENNALGILKDYNVSNIPYGLMRYAPKIDEITTQLDIQQYGLSQLINGIVYKKITIKDINANNNQNENGHVINYYNPTFLTSSIDKILIKKEYFNNLNEIVSEDIFNYDIINYGDFGGYKWNNVHVNSGQYPISNHYTYVLQIDPIFKIKYVLNNRESKKYIENSSFIKNEKTEYFYLFNSYSNSYDYNKIKEMVFSSNNEIIEKSVYKFYTEFNNIHQNYLYILNPIVLESRWVKSSEDWLLKYAKINDYNNYGFIDKSAEIIGNPTTKTFFNENNFVEPFYDQNQNLIYQSEDVTTFSYNDKWLVESIKNPYRKENTFFQRSSEYDGHYIDAILTSSIDNEVFFKKSFENSEEINTQRFNKAFSGYRVFNGNIINLGVYPSNFQVSFWSYENNDWKFNSFIHQGGDLSISKPNGALYIDELRVCPKNALIKSFTFNPSIGTTSTLDEKGFGKRIEYDLFNRPLFVFDKDGNVLKEYRYNNINID